MSAISAMSKTATVVMVDRNSRNRALLSDFLKKQGLHARTLSDLDELTALAQCDQCIDLVLVDIGGFRSDVWQSLERLRQAQIPFFVISPRWTPTVQRLCLASGGLGVLVKPLVPADLLKLIKSALNSAQR